MENYFLNKFIEKMDDPTRKRFSEFMSNQEMGVLSKAEEVQRQEYILNFIKKEIENAP